MLVVPGKSRISHHSSPTAFGSAPFYSRYLRWYGGHRVCFSRVCFAPLVSHDRHRNRTHPVLSSRGTLVCLSPPFEQNTTANEKLRLAAAVFSLRGPRSRMPPVDFPISVSSVTIEPSRERMDCEYVDGLADRTRLLFTVLTRE